MGVQNKRKLGPCFAQTNPVSVLLIHLVLLGHVLQLVPCYCRRRRRRRDTGRAALRAALRGGASGRRYRAASSMLFEGGVQEQFATRYPSRCRNGGTCAQEHRNLDRMRLTRKSVHESIETWILGDLMAPRAFQSGAPLSSLGPKRPRKLNSRDAGNFRRQSQKPRNPMQNAKWGQRPSTGGGQVPSPHFPPPSGRYLY